MSRKVAILVVLASAVACGDADPAGPATITDDYELPLADASLDPDRLTLGRYIATPCAFRWSGGDGLADFHDRHELETVDIFFGNAQWDGPTREDLRFVESHGGRVLHRFNVRAVRVRIQLSRIPDLVRTGDWITVRDVPDPSRYDIPSLGVGFARDLRESDIEHFVRLGGQVTHRLPNIRVIFGHLPDISVPAVRALPGIRFVEVSGVACLA